MAVIPGGTADAWGPPSTSRPADKAPAPRVDARRIMKHALATALSGTGVDAVLGVMLRGRAPLVVGYHRVVDQFDRAARHGMPGMLVSQAMLERHLDQIGRRYRFVTLDELGAALERGDRLTRAVAAVTFDDGYRDVYENALPLLRRKGIPAAVFVVSDLVGTHRLQLHDRLYLLILRALGRPAVLTALIDRHLATPAALPSRTAIAVGSGDPIALTRALLHAWRYARLQAFMTDLEHEVGPLLAQDEEGLWPMTWDMLAELARHDITIGSHTRRHALLDHEDPEVLRQEVDGSRRRLEGRLGRPVRHFAYPDGSFNATAVRAVADSGYKFAYTTCSHQDRRHPFLTISRRLLWERSSVDSTGQFAPAILDCQAQGFFAGSRGCRQRSHD